MRKIANVYRPWDGGPDKLGGEGYPLLNPKLEIRNPKEPTSNVERRSMGVEAWTTEPPRLRASRSGLALQFFAVLKVAYWSFSAPTNGIGVRTRFLACRADFSRHSFSATAEASQRRPEFGVSPNPVQTRSAGGANPVFDRVWPGLAGFSRV